MYGINYLLIVCMLLYITLCGRRIIAEHQVKLQCEVSALQYWCLTISMSNTTLVGFSSGKNQE